MKKFVGKMLVVGSLLLGFGSVSAEQRATEATSVLFLQTAKSADLIPQSLRGHYTLSLHQVNSSVLWFTDRPARTAGTLGLQKFLKLWESPKDANNFKMDHPNAALMSLTLASEDSDKSVAPVFTLSHPIYLRAKQTLSYDAILVQGSTAPTQNHLQDVAVYVDSKIGEFAPPQQW